MPSELQNKTVHGLFWSFAERIGQQAIGFILSIILARLLMPEEFGLIAMLMVFIAVGQVFTESGYGQALIHKQNATHVDECSIFYFNVFLGLVMAGILCLAAPWIAAFYERPALVPLTRVLSLSLVIGAFEIIQVTLLTKQMDFKTQLKISVVATAISGIVGIAMAYQGYGVWSLVGQTLCRTTAQVLLLWTLHSWRPAWTFSFASLRSMFGFGSKLLAASLVRTVFDNLYLITIGKLFTAGDLGFYTRAKGLQQLPVRNMSSALERVTFPVFASVQHDKDRLKRGVRKAMTTLAMINFPMMAGLAIVAEPLVVVLLTEKWLSSVPYLQLLCVVGALYPLQSINLNVLKAQGRSDLYFRLTLLKNALKVVLLAITWRWGIEAILWGQIATSLVGFLVNTYYTAKLIDYSIWEQIRDLIPYAAVVAVMSIGIYPIGYVITGHMLILLTVQTAAGVALVLGMCWVFRPAGFEEVWQLGKQNSRWRTKDA